MVVSGAVREFAGILECFERADTEVRDITLRNESCGSDEEICADLTVRVPVLAGTELPEEISIEAPNAELQESKVDIDLTVTVPVDEASKGTGTNVLSEINRSPIESKLTSSSGKPPYKDPEVLETVYEEYDTFPAMTEALNVDVTSETVRRYMVKHGIHNPDETADGSETATEESVKTLERATDQSEPSADEPTTSDIVADDEDAGESPATTDDATNETDETTDETGSEIGEMPAAKMLAEADESETDGAIVADGIGISPELTVDELAGIIEEARTVYEVKNQLGLDHDETRRLLHKANLIEFVTGRLARQQIELTPAEIHARVTGPNADES